LLDLRLAQVLYLGGRALKLDTPHRVASLCVRLHLHQIAPLLRFLICSTRRLAGSGILGEPFNLAAPHCVASLRVRLHFHRIAPFFWILFVTAVPSNIASAMPKPARDSG
jgi:hypothetical protein